MARAKKSTTAVIELTHCLEADVFSDDADTTNAEELANSFGITAAQVIELLPVLGVESVDPNRIPLSVADGIAERISQSLLTPAPAPEKVEVITVQAIAEQTGLTPAQTIQILAECRVKVESPDSPIPVAIAEQVFSVSNAIRDQSHAKLETLSLPEGTTPEEAEEKSLALSFSEAKTISQANGVSIKAVNSMSLALRQRSRELAIQEGYYEAQELTALRNLGKSFAALEEYREQSAELEGREDVLAAGRLDPMEIAASLGIDFRAILQQQEKLDGESQTKKLTRQAIAEKVTKGESVGAEELPCPLEMMRSRLSKLKI